MWQISGMMLQDHDISQHKFFEKIPSNWISKIKLALHFYRSMRFLLHTEIGNRKDEGEKFFGHRFSSAVKTSTPDPLTHFWEGFPDKTPFFCITWIGNTPHAQIDFGSEILDGIWWGAKRKGVSLWWDGLHENSSQFENKELGKGKTGLKIFIYQYQVFIILV